MGLTEILIILSMTAVPASYEVYNCLNPKINQIGAVCSWEEKVWVKRFDIDSKEYYYTLTEKESTDNCIERAMRRRYLKKRRK